jgi:hypothetical protein
MTEFAFRDALSRLWSNGDQKVAGITAPAAVSARYVVTTRAQTASWI